MSVTKVAQLAGVSRMTVSRVINKDPRVRPETAEQVRQAMAAVNYVPPSAKRDGRRRSAKAVSGLHTSRIVVLVPDTSADAMRTTLTGRLLHGIDGPVDQRKLNMLLTRLPSPKQLPACIDRRQIDGVILRATEGKWILKALENIPTVWMFNAHGLPSSVDRVDVDDAAVGRLVAEHFLEQGHKRMAVVNDQPKHIAHELRIDAFREVVEQAGGSVQVTDVENYNREYVEPAVVKLLRPKNRPTAIFLPGMGPMVSQTQRAIRAAGFEPEKDVATVGCGHDRNLIEAMYPQPANIDIQPEAIGKAAAEQLIWRLANPIDPPRHTLISPLLVLPKQD